MRVPAQAFYYDPTLTIQARRDVFAGAQLGATSRGGWQDWVIGGVFLAVATATATWLVRDARAS